MGKKKIVAWKPIEPPAYITGPCARIIFELFYVDLQVYQETGGAFLGRSLMVHACALVNLYLMRCFRDSLLMNLEKGY